MAVGLSGVNKVKIFKEKSIVAEFKLQAPPLGIDFCMMNEQECIVMSGVEGVVYIAKLKDK